MINAWSLLYDELNGTMDENFPIKKQEDDDVTPCKLEDIKITTENDPIFTVGSGNTAVAESPNYYVDTTQLGDISIDTSALDNEGIAISGGDAAINFDDITFIESEIGVSTSSSDSSSDYDTVTLNIPDDSPLSQNFLADNDDAAAHHFTTLGI